MPSNLIKLTHLQQEEDGECLGVCVDMVLEYVGQKTSYQQLVKVLKLNVKYGTSFRHIRNLRRLGFAVRYYDRATFETMATELAQGNPCIVPVHADEFPYWPFDYKTQHAVVVVGLDDEHVWIHDPAEPIAPLAVPSADFDLAWLGMNEQLAVIVP